MSLTQFQTEIQELKLLQSSWASVIDPFTANPSLKSIILKKVNLIIGTNTVNHLLGRKLQGYRIVRQRGPAAIYDNQDNNQSPALTLLLVSDTVVTVDLEVF